MTMLTGALIVLGALYTAAMITHRVMYVKRKSKLEQ